MLREGTTGREVLARLDKAAIFALIVGTHTPVQGFFFRGFARYGVLTLMWAIAATGITLFSIFHEELPHGLGTAVYLLLGWIAGTAGIIAWRRLGTRQLWQLLLGGLFYSLGALCLGLRWPTLFPSWFGPHELWHVAVLVALSLHWKFVYQHAALSLDGDPRAGAKQKCAGGHA